MLSRSLRARLSDLIRQGSSPEHSLANVVNEVTSGDGSTSGAGITGSAGVTGGDGTQEHAPEHVAETSNPLVLGPVEGLSTQLAAQQVVNGFTSHLAPQHAPEHVGNGVANHASAQHAPEHVPRVRTLSERRMVHIGIEELLPGGVLSGPNGSLFIHERLYTDLGEEPGAILERLDALCRLAPGAPGPATEKKSRPKRRNGKTNGHANGRANGQAAGRLNGSGPNGNGTRSVSYTHLTLPTILRV